MEWIVCLRKEVNPCKRRLGRGSSLGAVLVSEQRRRFYGAAVRMIGVRVCQNVPVNIWNEIAFDPRGGGNMFHHGDTSKWSLQFLSQMPSITVIV